MLKKYRVISFSILLTFLFNTLAFAENTSSIQDKIDQNKSEIESLENEKNKINKEINNENENLQNILDEIEAKNKELEEVQKEVDEYEAKINEVQNNIDEINLSIEASETKIKETEELIKQKEKEEKEIKENINIRVRSYYKVDITTNIIYMILKSDDIFSLFSNLENVFKIINLDKKMMNEANRLKNELAEEKENINQELDMIKENKNTLVAKQDELKEAQKEYIAKQEYHQSKIDELYALENEKTILIASLSDKESELQDEIGDLIAYNSELQAELDRIFEEINSNNNQSGNQNQVIEDTASGENDYNNGNGNNEEDSSENTLVTPGDPSTESFLRPGSGVITDPYGQRINPVTFEPGFHTGTDFGDPYGAPVLASKSGTVVYSGWINGYGETIILDHGSGVQTLYAHNSSRLVSVGQTVARGQTIALVGSTGMSTGPHIHFEIRINGQHVNPMDYL